MAGRRPRDIAPDLYSVCKRKNSKLHEALTDNRWIRDLTVGPNCSLHHLQQLVELWFAVKDTSINQVEMDGQRGVHYSLSISGTISGVNQNGSASTHLETMGATKVQIFCMARYQE